MNNFEWELDNETGEAVISDENGNELDRVDLNALVTAWVEDNAKRLFPKA